MLTPEQIKEYRAKAGIPEQGLGSQQPITSPSDRINKLRSTTGISPILNKEPGIIESFKKGVGESYKSSQQFAETSLEDYLSGRQGAASTALQASGAGAKLLNSIIGEGVKSSFDITKKAIDLVPDSLKQSMGIPVVAEGVKTIINTPMVQAGLSELSKGIDAYTMWAKDHPEASKNLESVVNIAALVPLVKTARVGIQAAEKGIPEAVKTIEELPASIRSGMKELSTTGKELIAGSPEALALKQSKTALEAITPKATDLTPAEYGDLLRKGRITPKTATSPASYVLNEKEKQLAQKFAPLLQSNDSVQNGQNVLTEIINKDVEVGKFLAKEPKVYIKDDLRQTLTDRLSQVNDILVPKDQLSTARKDLINTIMAKIPNNNTGRTFDKLWQFRKELDRTIENKLNAFSGSPTLKKEMTKGIRDGIQSFIEKNTADGVYKTYMKDMSQLYDVLDMITVKATKEKGLSALRLWVKNNAEVIKILKIGGWIALGAEAGHFITQ